MEGFLLSSIIGFLCHVFYPPLSLSFHLPPQEHYLPFVLSSKLKLWCNDGSDRGLVSFLDTSLQDETSRSVLELHYPEELTLSYILRDDYDRAYYYLNLSLQAAQQVSALYAFHHHVAL